MPLFRFLVAWANVPFAIAAGVAAVFALLQVTGVLGLVAGGGDGDHDADGDVNADADADVDHDVDADHDVDHDADAEHDGDHGGARDAHGRSFALAALGPFGLGKIPLSVMWQTFCIAFALAGFALNARYLGGDTGVPPVHSLAWTMPLSVLAGALCVAGVARLLGPVLSSKEQEATSRAQLVGQIGVVISSRVDRDFGEVRIRDKTGHDIRVVCKLAQGAKRAPTEHQNVVVVDYEPERGELLVEALEEGELGETGTSGR